MSRITDKDLQAVVARINRITGSPMDYAQPCAKGVLFCSNIGNYHLDYAYGGVQLCRVCNTGGGVSNVLGCGHVSKRELYERMHAFISGLEASK
jgi:hypothetical protein